MGAGQGLLTVLSVSLGLARAVAWVRSLSADEVYVFEPLPMPWGSSGWFAHWIVGSGDGRLVVIEHEELDITIPRMHVQGYLDPAPAGALAKPAYFPHATYGEVAGFASPGGLVEWASVPRQVTTGGRRYFAVSWPLLVFLFALYLAVRGGRRWFKSRYRPAFPVGAAT